MGSRCSACDLRSGRWCAQVLLGLTPIMLQAGERVHDQSVRNVERSYEMTDSLHSHAEYSPLKETSGGCAWRRHFPQSQSCGPLGFGSPASQCISLPASRTSECVLRSVFCYSVRVSQQRQQQWQQQWQMLSTVSRRVLCRLCVGRHRSQVSSSSSSQSCRLAAAVRSLSQS